MVKLNTTQAAEILRVHRDTITSLIRRGHLIAGRDERGRYVLGMATLRRYMSHPPKKGNPHGWSQFNERRGKRRKRKGVKR